MITIRAHFDNGGDGAGGDLMATCTGVELMGTNNFRELRARMIEGAAGRPVRQDFFGADVDFIGTAHLDQVVRIMPEYLADIPRPDKRGVCALTCLLLAEQEARGGKLTVPREVEDILGVSQHFTGWTNNQLSAFMKGFDNYPTDMPGESYPEHFQFGRQMAAELIFGEKVAK